MRRIPTHAVGDREALQQALATARYWKAVWDGFWWISIGSCAAALVLAILVTPECLGC